MEWIPYNPDELELHTRYLVFYEMELGDGSLWHDYTIDKFGWIEREYGIAFTRGENPHSPKPAECTNQKVHREFVGEIDKGYKVLYVMKLERPECH